MSILSDKERKESRRESFKLHLDDSHLIAIGHVAVRSAMLDKLIDLTFERIISPYPPLLQKTLKDLSSPKRIDAIKEDITKHLPAYKKEISDFISEIYSARDERNDILHRMWRSTDTAELKSLVEISHDGEELEKRRVSSSSMRDVANRLLDLAIELGDWKLHAMHAQLGQSSASPERPDLPIGLPPVPRSSKKGSK